MTSEVEERPKFVTGDYGRTGVDGLNNFYITYGLLQWQSLGDLVITRQFFRFQLLLGYELVPCIND